uniref:CHAT domain-containing protein n=2 Tax=Pinguiococcus pyrenoidosus TaxID=172671 RepID=A0A7R9Y8X2_9STRA
MSLDECMPYFRVGETVAIRASLEVLGEREGTICGDLDGDGKYEVEMARSQRRRICAKHLARRMRVSPSRLLERYSNPLKALRFSEEEARQVGDILGLEEDDVLIGDKATLPEVQRRMATSTGVIHLATHGLVDPQVGGRSGVALCGSSHGEAILTAHAVASMECMLQSPLVVLSACDSGRGEEFAEGVLGLARAFTMAGADSVVMSLWEVDDHATQRLMKLFYETWLEVEDADGAEADGAEADGADGEAKQVLRVKCSVVEAWTEAVRSWLTIHSDPERHLRARAYELLGMEITTGNDLSKEDLSKACYKAYVAQEKGSQLGDELLDVSKDLSEEDLSHEKSKYCHPLYWAAFGVVGV